jgi:hypothetical protein
VTQHDVRELVRKKTLAVGASRFQPCFGKRNVVADCERARAERVGARRRRRVVV